LAIRDRRRFERRAMTPRHQNDDPGDLFLDDAIGAAFDPSWGHDLPALRSHPARPCRLAKKKSATLLNRIFSAPRSLSAPGGRFDPEPKMNICMQGVPASRADTARIKREGYIVSQRKCQMSTRVQGWLHKGRSTVLDWLMIALSFGTIAWISFQTIGG
jgi:hypothetical protein